MTIQMNSFHKKGYNYSFALWKRSETTGYAGELPSENCQIGCQTWVAGYYIHPSSTKRQWEWKERGEEGYPDSLKTASSTSITHPLPSGHSRNLTPAQEINLTSGKRLGWLINVILWMLPILLPQKWTQGWASYPVLVRNGEPQGLWRRQLPWKVWGEDGRS